MSRRLRTDKTFLLRALALGGSPDSLFQQQKIVDDDLILSALAKNARSWKDWTTRDTRLRFQSKMFRIGAAYDGVLKGLFRGIRHGSGSRLGMLDQGNDVSIKRSVAEFLIPIGGKLGETMTVYNRFRKMDLGIDTRPVFLNGEIWH